MSRPARPPLAVVLGGGGPFGIAYGCGALEALTAAGVPVAGAPVLGTSAGAWAGAALRLGVPATALMQLSVRVPEMRPGRLAAMAREVFGDGPCPGLTAGVVALPNLRPVLLDAAALPVHRVVAASSAVPGLFAPVRVGRSFYVDGGVRPTATPAAAPDADVLLVISPISGPGLGPVGPLLAAAVARQMSRWQARTGGIAVLLRPSAALTSRLRQPLDLFRQTDVAEVCTSAREQAAGWLRSDRAAALRTLIAA